MLYKAAKRAKMPKFNGISAYAINLSNHHIREAARYERLPAYVSLIALQRQSREAEACIPRLRCQWLARQVLGAA
jgi:hypothetical protein